MKERDLLDRELWGTLDAARNGKEFKTLLKALLTESEEVMLARRIQIAKLLLKGATHESIRRKLAVGFATIQSVDRWLAAVHAAYRKDFSAIGGGKASPRRERVPADYGTFRSLRKKYPGEFLLFNLLLGEPE